jgi:hypothetical protein
MQQVDTVLRLSSGSLAKCLNGSPNFCQHGVSHGCKKFLSGMKSINFLLFSIKLDLLLIHHPDALLSSFKNYHSMVKSYRGKTKVQIFTIIRPVSAADNPSCNSGIVHWLSFFFSACKLRDMVSSHWR